MFSHRTLPTLDRPLQELETLLWAVCRLEHRADDLVGEMAAEVSRRVFVSERKIIFPMPRGPRFSAGFILRIAGTVPVKLLGTTGAYSSTRAHTIVPVSHIWPVLLTGTYRPYRKTTTAVPHSCFRGLDRRQGIGTTTN